MTVELGGTGRLRALVRVVVHDGHDADVVVGLKRAPVVRMLTPVEEDQMTSLRSQDRARALDVGPAAGRLIVTENQLATAAWTVIGAEQQTGQRVGIHVALKPHLWSTLHVQHRAVPLVRGR